MSPPLPISIEVPVLSQEIEQSICVLCICILILPRSTIFRLYFGPVLTVFITLVFRFDLHVRLLIISLIFPLNIPFVFLPT